MYKEKIIIDTDIGDDVDDALAISLALNSPEVDLLGITTVYRNAERRAKLTVKLLEVFGVKNVPVYAGLSYPFLQQFVRHERDTFDEKGMYIPCQFSPDMEQMIYNKDKNAIEFIRDTVCSMPGEVILVPIGALTNIAAAIKMYPEICQMVKGITLMGGIHGEQFAEWNIHCDPEAAKIVFLSGIPINMVGLDVTMKCRMNQDEVNRIRNLNSSAAAFLSTLIDKWLDFYQFGSPVLHDPLAVASLIDDNIIKFEERYLEVGLYGEQRGCIFTMHDKLIPKPCTWPKVNVAVDADRDRFLEMFLSRLTTEEVKAAV